MPTTRARSRIDLIVTLDDATSAIYSIFLVEEEGTASSFRGLEEVISRHGLLIPLSSTGEFDANLISSIRCEDDPDRNVIELRGRDQGGAIEGIARYAP